MEYWNRYYRGDCPGDSPIVKDPTSFFSFCLQYLTNCSTVVEFGCGSGRDAQGFLSRGIQYHGIDMSEAAVSTCTQKFLVDDHSFMVADFSSPDLVETLRCKNSFPGKYDCVYSRFCFHSITDEQQRVAISNSCRLLAPGGHLCIEARSVKDPRYGCGVEVGKHAFVDTHYRRFIDLHELLVVLRESGFRVVSACEEYVSCQLGDDKAVVVRFVCEKLD